ncbi:uncharacterized protein LOC112553474 isoform X2 [Pomacea canaliculata]|uniref:uncharacterized protein LOC112553474 isoform X2 n=1 Tax=Pomacea canaliculata TaxID=400727 RepID=UPI000D72B833|nr:uncharacterized protein LOC112553474 isoform X2 [Pomacea canaliculata]
MYHILEVIEDGKKRTTIVPDEWLITTGSNKCFWPNCNADLSWVKHRRKPGPNWRVFNYKRIVKSTSSYEKSLDLLMKAAYSSELRSNCLADAAAECSARQKQRSRPRKIWSPSCVSADDLSHTFDLDVETSPEVILGTHLSSAALNMHHHLPQRIPAPNSSRARSRSPVCRSLPSASHAPPRPLVVCRSRSQSPIDRQCLHAFTSAPPSVPASWLSTPSATVTDLPSGLCIEQVAPFFERMFTKMEEFMSELKILQEKVDHLEARLGQAYIGSKPLVPALPEGFILPLQEVVQLEQMNSDLADTEIKHRMVLYLFNFGGRSPKDALYRMLKELLEPQLSILYSMEGKKGKLKFNSLKNFKMTVYEAIMLKFKEATVAALDKYTGEWLSMSCDRGGGRKKREEEKKKLQQQEQCC